MVKKNIIISLLTTVIILCNIKAAYCDELEDKVIKEKDNYQQKSEINNILESNYINEDIDLNNDYLITGEEKEVKKYKDVSRVSDYNLTDFMNKLKDSGVEYKLFSKEKDYFDGNKYIISLYDTRITIYDYEEISTIKKDIAVIKKRGPIINGAHLSKDTIPKYYYRGELIIIYEGTNENILNLLKDNLEFIR